MIDVQDSPVDQFCNNLRERLNEVDKRMNSFKANVESANAKAKADIHAQLDKIKADFEDRKLVARDSAPGSDITIINWSQEERDKFRGIAQGAWADISKQSPLAKEAYDAHIAFMKKTGMLQ